eukprot:IDg23457t1
MLNKLKVKCIIKTCALGDWNARHLDWCRITVPDDGEALAMPILVLKRCPRAAALLGCLGVSRGVSGGSLTRGGGRQRACSCKEGSAGRVGSLRSTMWLEPISLPIVCSGDLDPKPASLLY